MIIQNQTGPTKGKSCLTKLVVFLVTASVDKVRATNTLSVAFCKYLDKVPTTFLPLIGVIWI